MATLMQEPHRGKHWPVLLCGLLLSRTKRPVAEPILRKILERWPTWREADRDLAPVVTHLGHVQATTGPADWLFDALKPGGLAGRRLEAVLRWLVQFRREGLPRTRADAEALHGVGEYVADSFTMFVLDDYRNPPLSGDRALMEEYDARRLRTR